MATIHHVSDTARLAAMFRAKENERPEPLFRDPYARKLAGEEGERIIASLPFHTEHEWSWITRTVLFNRVIEEEIRGGVDTVVNLAAGLDARPYWMTLPGNLRWIEADLPGILDYKESLLQGETPRCELERVRVDLSDASARAEFFRSVTVKTRKALVITEGLLVYLTAEQVAGLAEEMAQYRQVTRWVTDLASPGLLAMLQKETHHQFSEGATPLQFAPENGPAFFEPHGWKLLSSPSMLHEAARLKRLPNWRMRMFAMLPVGDTKKMGKRPWSGVCVFENQKLAASN